MIMWLQALGLLCGLGAAAFGAAASRRTAEAAVAFAAFLTTLAWSGFLQVPAFGTVGVVVAGGAAARVFRPGWTGPVGLTAGFLSGVWISLLYNQGLPLGLAVLMGTGFPLTAAFLARTRPGFAPDFLVEDSMLVVGVLGLVVAAGPTIADGLRTAGTINVPYASRYEALPVGFVVVTILAATAGGGYTLWWRNR